MPPAASSQACSAATRASSVGAAAAADGVDAALRFFEPIVQSDGVRAGESARLGVGGHAADTDGEAITGLILTEISSTRYCTDGPMSCSKRILQLLGQRVHRRRRLLAIYEKFTHPQQLNLHCPHPLWREPVE